MDNGNFWWQFTCDCVMFAENAQFLATDHKRFEVCLDPGSVATVVSGANDSLI
jgi:hypothetical protein